MRENNLEDYKQADRELEREEARRSFTIHAIVYALVMTGLIILNLTVATEFPWAVFPLVGWGIGLTAHYLFGLRWVNQAITEPSWVSCRLHRGCGSGWRAAVAV